MTRHNSRITHVAVPGWDYHLPMLEVSLEQHQGSTESVWTPCYRPNPTSVAPPGDTPGQTAALQRQPAVARIELLVSAIAASHMQTLHAGTRRVKAPSMLEVAAVQVTACRHNLV